MRFPWLLGPLILVRQGYQMVRLFFGSSVTARRFAAAGAVFTFAAPPIAFVSDLKGLSEPLCKVEVVRTMACRPIGLGGVPSPKEDERFRLAKAKGCAGLQDFVNTETESPLVDDATRLLVARRSVAAFRPAPPAVMEFSADGVGSSEADARAAFAKDAAAAATRACAPLETAQEHHLLGSDPRPVSPACEQIGARWMCRGQGLTNCRIETRVVTEVCG